MQLEGGNCQLARTSEPSNRKSMQTCSMISIRKAMQHTYKYDVINSIL